MRTLRPQPQSQSPLVGTWTVNEGTFVLNRNGTGDFARPDRGGMARRQLVWEHRDCQLVLEFLPVSGSLKEALYIALSGRPRQIYPVFPQDNGQVLIVESKSGKSWEMVRGTDLDEEIARGNSTGATAPEKLR